MPLVSSSCQILILCPDYWPERGTNEKGLLLVYAAGGEPETIKVVGHICDEVIVRVLYETCLDHGFVLRLRICFLEESAMRTPTRGQISAPRRQNACQTN